jgi:GlpG protein
MDAPARTCYHTPLMRLIGHLDNDKDARTFGDFLYVQKIETEFEREGNQWAVWVRSDDDVPAATKLLAEFRANPNDAKYLAGSPAAKLREQAKAEDEAYRKRVVPAKKLMPSLSSHGFGVVTYSLIAVCVSVFLISNFGRDLGRISALFIVPIQSDGDTVTWTRGWGAILGGEVWRLVTPILIHFPTSAILIAHILFNMMWLRDLGSLFEARLGSLYFATFVVVVGALSNAGEYAWSGQPIFGGMSGVNYALIGYCWVRGRFDPSAGIGLDRQSMIWAMIWFAVCFTGLVGPIANAAHTGGLVLGAAWAFVDGKRR